MERNPFAKSSHFKIFSRSSNQKESLAKEQVSTEMDIFNVERHVQI